MNRTRLTLIKTGTVVPAPTGTGTVGAAKIDMQAVQARQRDAGRTRRALAILTQAMQRPTVDAHGRRVG